MLQVRVSHLGDAAEPRTHFINGNRTCYPYFLSSNASGKFKGKGGTKEYPGKSTEKEGSQEEIELYFFSLCTLWNS